MVALEKKYGCVREGVLRKENGCLRGIMAALERENGRAWKENG